MEFPFRIPTSDVGRRLTSVLSAGDEERWTALVVARSATPSTSSAPPTQAPSAPDPASGGAGAAPTLAATGASSVRGALLGGLLLLVGLFFTFAARRNPGQHH